MENWTLGGDMEMISGAGEVPRAGAPEGGAEILLALEAVGGNCLLGDLGELAGEDMEEQRGLRSRAGLGAGGQPLLEAGTGPVSSSGRGPSIEPPEAELTPDMADTEFLSSAALERIREF